MSLEVEEAIVNMLWEELKQGKIKAQSKKRTPFKEIDFDQKTLVLEIRYKLVDDESERTIESAKGTLNTLLSFQKESMKPSQKPRGFPLKGIILLESLDPHPTNKHKLS